MEAMPTPPEKPSAAEAEVAPPAEAPSSPAQKDAVTLPAGKTASGEGMESTEVVSGAISKPEPPSIGVRSSLFHRFSILVTELDGAAQFVLLLTGLYALLTPWVLWGVGAGGQPVTLIWTTSLVAISHSLTGSMCLSTVSRLGVLLRFACATLLAVAAGRWIGPTSGAAVASLVACYGAGILGYSAGEHLQRLGIENSADALASRPQRLDEETQEKRDQYVFTYCFAQVIMTVMFLGLMVWKVVDTGSAMAGYDPVTLPLLLVQDLSETTLVLAWMWSSFIALAPLDQALVSGDTVFWKALICIGAVFTLSILLDIFKLFTATMLIMWTAAMAGVGFLGYCLAVYARYQHIQSRNQSVSASGKMSQDGPSEVLDEPNKVLGEQDQKPDGCTSLVITIGS